MFCPYCERLMPIEDIKKLIGKYIYHIKSELELFDTEPNSSNVISFFVKRNEIVKIIEIGEKLPNDNNSIMLQLKTNNGKRGWCTSKCFFMALFS